MILSELIKSAHIAYKGNLRVPNVGSDKYNIYVDIANRKQREWANDPNTDWVSLYREESIGTSSTSSSDYELEAELLRPSDFVYIKIDDVYHPYELTDPDKHINSSNAAYLHGFPKTLTFNHTIPSYRAGGEVILPAYYMPDPLVNPGDEVAVDDPNWLVYELASELARNDFSKDDQFANLKGMANDLYLKMKTANDVSSYNQENAKVPFNMPSMGL